MVQSELLNWEGKDMQSDTFEQLHPDFNEFLSGKLRQSALDPNIMPQTKEDMQHYSAILHSVACEVKKQSTEISKNNQKILATLFYQEFDKIWGFAFSLSDVFASMAFDLCTELTVQRDKEHITAYVLSKLVGKGIKTYSEIIVLLKNGYPQGAMALTRLICEIMVFSRFIKKYGDEVALAFHDEADKPMDQSRDNYEWAKKAGCFTENQKIFFRSIMEKSLFESENVPHDNYAWLCKYAHASAQTIIHEPHLFDENIHTGPSIHGIEAAAKLSASMLGVMLCDLSEFLTDINACRRLHFLLCWAVMMKDEFRKIANNIKDNQSLYHVRFLRQTPSTTL